MWIEFHPATHTQKGDSAITISRKYKLIRLLQRVVLENKLDKFEWATMYYDPDKKLIGIKPSNIQHPNSVKLYMHKKTHLQISCKEFMEVANPPEGHYPCRWCDKTNMLVARLTP